MEAKRGGGIHFLLPMSRRTAGMSVKGEGASEPRPRPERGEGSLGTHGEESGPPGPLKSAVDPAGTRPR